jgi:hypothetical protein
MGNKFPVQSFKFTVKIRYAEKNLREIDRENPGFRGKRPPFKILAMPLP